MSAAMKALLRAPEIFFTTACGPDQTLPIHFGRLKMPVHREPKGPKLSASFNGGKRKITVSCDRDVYAEGVLPDDSFEDCGEFNRSINIWWDVGWCPPPSNFDVSKIGITVIEAVRLLNTSRPIYFRVYGKVGELLPRMAKDAVRIISDSGFKLAGFELKDDSNYVSDLMCTNDGKCFTNGFKKTLMTEDLHYYQFCSQTRPKPIHMVILDGKVITASDLYELLDYHYSCLICVEPEQESVDGNWRWKPLWPVQLSLLMGQCKSNGGRNSLDESGYGLSNDDANVNTVKIDEIVSIWWDFRRCPLPLNFDTPKIVSNITKALHRLNLLGSSIYFHAYGNIQEIGEDIVRFVCQSGFQIVGLQLDGRKIADNVLVEDLEFNLDLQTTFSRPQVINIIISDGYGYECDSLDSLQKDGNIIMPSEIILHEGPQGAGLSDDLIKDDENTFLEHHMEFGYLVGRQSPDHKRSVNVWWDASRCPPPLNFDVSKIGITIVEVMRLINTSCPIYLRVYGNMCELLPKMAKDTKRIISESGFKLSGFEMKDNSKVSDFVLKGFQRNRKYFSHVLEENLMMEDLIYYGIHNGATPQAIHVVVSDGKVISATVLDQHRRQINCHVICLEPEHEAVNGVWRWMPLRLNVV